MLRFEFSGRKISGGRGGILKDIHSFQLLVFTSCKLLQKITPFVWLTDKLDDKRLQNVVDYASNASYEMVRGIWKPLTKKQSRCIVSNKQNIFAFHTKGVILKASKIHEICDAMCITTTRTTAYHPQCNCQTEHQYRTQQNKLS